MDVNSDGSVTYRFGAEEAQADAGVAVAAPPPPPLAHTSSSSNGSSNGSSGALSHAAPSAGEAGPLPAAAEVHLGEPLQEALHLRAHSSNGSSSSNGNGSSNGSSNGNGSSRNGSAPSSSGRGGAAAAKNGAALGAIAGDALQQPSDIPAAAAAKDDSKAPAKLDPLTADYAKAPSGSLLALYNACCRGNDLDTALLVLKQAIRAGRGDVLKR